MFDRKLKTNNICRESIGFRRVLKYFKITNLNFTVIHNELQY